MSIINLEKTFKNEQLVYCNIDNKIIECTCLSKLYKCNTENDYLATFTCSKVKIIAIYDIYKNIIYEPIQICNSKDTIKLLMIIENLLGNIALFKTFMRSLVKKNNLYNIKFYMDYTESISEFLYYIESIVEFSYYTILLIDSIKHYNIYNNKGKRTYNFYCHHNSIIHYENYNDRITYDIYSNHIIIKKRQFQFYQTIYYDTKNLKISSIEKYHEYIKESHEHRDYNNEINYVMKINNTYMKQKTESFSNDMNPPFSKPLKKDCIELINYYKKNINNCIKLINYCLKKEKRNT